MGLTDLLVTVARKFMKAKTLSNRSIRMGIDVLGYKHDSIAFAGGFDNPMNKREALLILGMKGQFNLKELRTRHTKMAIKNHPDRGGSVYITNKINEAKDFLADYMETHGQE